MATALYVFYACNQEMLFITLFIVIILILNVSVKCFQSIRYLHVATRAVLATSTAEIFPPSSLISAEDL